MKKWYKSKTVLFNLVLAMLTAAEASFSLLQGYLPINTYAVLSFIMTVGNVGLRFVSTQTLVDRRKTDDAVTTERRG